MNRTNTAAVAALFSVASVALGSVASADTFAVIGDAGKINSNADSVRESIQRQKVHRLILPGDNLYHKTYTKVWQAWRDLSMTFDVVAIGNHNDGYAEEVRYFDMPGEYYSKVIDSA